jgi:enoyl-CoA hydratase/carnithine racemase
MTITYEKKGHIGIFTIDNGKVNALTFAMHDQLYSHLDEFLNDSTIKVGILKGSEGKCFCAGDDLNEGDVYPEGQEDTTKKILTLPRNKPIIAAVNSWCLGEGFVYLMMLTDIRVAGTGARFGLPEIAYAMAGASGATRLPLHIPRVSANWIALTGEKITADQALHYQLINEVVPDDEVFNRALEIAHMIASHPLIAIQTEMECLKKCPEMTSEEAISLTRKLYDRQFRLYHQEPDAKSGIEHIKGQ